ncbi:MAG TPA: hemolysin family protein [Nocardioides sp.]|mgnify:FL=1|uniref:hemolysin family protein n=1 Tax=uncultured Nocardioides sp. TaxID=198441 RepID=UPI00261FE8CA|nr:hemolysin family protein [uncultured Nocardioides sp.]HRD61110.1 hemolysin family protein [Nocardioides sp.]HRI97590.1 hemolysin family protein [Nocardioides sp.]HRK44482.1 hemolysin family protein [Nocardioides sp.]
MIDTDTFANLALVVAFVLVGGVFAATEIALVSLRESQVDRLAHRGGRGERVASIARDPNRFLAAVQIGVTLAGFFSAAYGASTLAPDVAPHLEDLGLGEGTADALALLAMTLLIAYLSLVLGELAPKRLALQRAEGVSLLTAPALDRFATLMRPVIWLLSVSTNVVVRLLGGDPSARSEGVSQEELRDIVRTHEEIGADQRRIIGDVFVAATRSLKEVMRPRAEVAFVRAELPVTEAAQWTKARPHSRYPVIGESFDDVTGFLHVRDLVGLAPDDRRTLGELQREILTLPSTNQLLPTVALLRESGIHIAVVVDEYGGTDGIVTLEDLVEEIVGEIRDEYDLEPTFQPTSGGAIELEGGLSADDFTEQTSVELPDGPYETVAGFVISRLGRIPEVGDHVGHAGYQLTVAAMDGRRVTRVRLSEYGGEGHRGEGHSEGPPPDRR